MSSTLQELNRGPITGASQLAYFDPVNGAARRASVAQLAAVLRDTLTTPPNGLLTQYATPTATGFMVLIAPQTQGASVFLLLSPTGTLAAGTLLLPQGFDGQEVVVHTRQAITALTVTPATGQTLVSAPTTLAAGGFFRVRFDGPQSTWCRIG